MLADGANGSEEQPADNPERPALMKGSLRAASSCCSAVEILKPRNKSTLDVAALCKRADHCLCKTAEHRGILDADRSVSRIFSSCPISKPATCWRSSSNIRRSADCRRAWGLRANPGEARRQDARAVGSCAIMLLLARHKTEVKS